MGYRTIQHSKKYSQKNCAKKIVSDYWQTIVADKNLFLFTLAGSPKQLLKTALIAGTKPKEAVFLVGLSVLSQEEGGVRELRAVIERKHGARGWYRIAEGFKRLNANVGQKQCHSWVAQITASIKQFDSFKFKGCDLQELGITNQYVKNCKV